METRQAQAFANLTYDMNTTEDKAQRVANIDKQLPEGWAVVPNESNRRQLTLYNQTENHYHIAQRGTDPRNKKDLLQDASIGFLSVGRSNIYKQRHETLMSTIDNLPTESKLSMSGHSLGAAQTQYNLSTSKELSRRVSQVDLFNGASHPISNHAFGKTTQSQRNILRDKVVHHRNEQDLVSSGIKYSGTNMGTVRIYKAKPVNPLRTTVERLILGFSPTNILAQHSADFVY
jgi:hypothetical protein